MLGRVRRFKRSNTPIRREELNGIKIEARFEKIDEPTPEEKFWTVTLDGNEVKVKDGEKTDKNRQIRTKEGYKFLGWFVGDKKFDFDTAITKELNGIKIEARFEKIKDEPLAVRTKAEQFRQVIQQT